MPYKDKEKQKEYMRDYMQKRRNIPATAFTRKPFGVVTSIGKVVSSSTLDKYSLKQSEQLEEKGFQGIDGLVRPLYNPEYLARHLEANAYHNRCIQTKAQDTAGVGWRLHPLVDNPSEQQKELLLNFFDELPEPLVQVLVKAVMDREAVGYMAIEMAREGKAPEGLPVLLAHMPAHTVRAHQDGKRYVQIRGARRVWFKRAGLTDIDVDKKTGKISKAGTVSPEDRANEILWDVNYTPRSDIYGIPDHIPAMGAILGDLARRDYNIAFFENHGVPSYAIFVSGDYDPGPPVDVNGKTEDEGGEAPFKPALQWEIESHVDKLAKNPHSVMTLLVPTSGAYREGQVKIEFQPLATDVKDASFRLYRKDNRDEVFSAHAVPPYRAGVAETGSLGGNAAKEMDEIYRDSVVKPRQRRIENLIDAEVISAFGVTDWGFDLLDLDVSDEDRELDMALKLFASGAMSPNDLIRNFGSKWGLEPIKDEPAMDAHYVAGRPIDYDALPGADIEAVLEDTKKRLIEVAVKHAGVGDGDRVREILETVEEFKRSTGTTAKA